MPDEVLKDLKDGVPTEERMASIELRSPAFSDQAFIPERHAHDQDNVSPALEWSGIPGGATELLLLCEDPDAPSGTFLHWLVTGIDPSSTGINEGGGAARGHVWPNSFGERGWSGPQPPAGDPAHRYVFRIYALGRPLQLPPKPTIKDVHRLINEAAIASGTLVGRYQR